MRSNRSLVFALMLVLGVSASPAFAEGESDVSYMEAAPGTGLAIGSAGIFDFVSSDEGSTTGMVQAEFTLNYHLWRFGDSFTGFPYFGAFVTLDASALAFGGVQGLVPLGDSLEARPFFGLGVYREGDGKDLGSLVLFHTGLSMYYKLSGDRRIGLSYSHQSHGDIFSSDNNHGANNIMVSYAVPLDSLF